MAEVFGLVTGAAQLYASATEVIKLIMELRDELENGPRRIREHLKSLDSTISVLRFIESDPGSLNTKILYFVHEVKDKVEQLLALLQSNHQSLSCGPFRRVFGAFKTVKSAEKVNEEFAALDRDRANLHLYISARSDSAIQRLISITTMDPDKQIMSASLDKLLMRSDAPQQSDHDDGLALIPYNEGTVLANKSLSQREDESLPRAQQKNKSETNHPMKNLRDASTRQEEGGEQAGNNTNPFDGHIIQTKTEYGKNANRHIGDSINPNTSDYRPPSLKITSEDKFGDSATDHLGHKIANNQPKRKKSKVSNWLNSRKDE